MKTYPENVTGKLFKEFGRELDVLFRQSVNQENGCIPTTVTHTLNSAENRRAPIEVAVHCAFSPRLTCCSLEWQRRRRGVSHPPFSLCESWSNSCLAFYRAKTLEASGECPVFKKEREEWETKCIREPCTNLNHLYEKVCHPMNL